MAYRSSGHRRSGWILFLVFSTVVFLPAQANDAEKKSLADLNARVEELYKQGQYSRAEPLAKEELQRAEAAYGAEDPAIALAANNLARLYRAEAKYAQAEPLFRRSLAIREKTLGPEHPDVAQTLHGLCQTYHAEARLAEAEQLCKRALAIREKVLGPEHADVAQSLNELAAVYSAETRLAQAEELAGRGLAIREKVLGPEHPDTARSLNTLAAIYVTQARYSEAEPLLQRALVIRKRELGPEHPAVAQSLGILANLYISQARYPEAESLAKQALVIREKTNGLQHPAVARTLDFLGSVYYQEGRYPEAELMHRRALRIWEESLGPEHPNVAVSLNNLGLLYQLEGRFREAESLLERALAISEQTGGPENPHVAACLDNLGDLYRAERHYARAESAYKRSLAILEKTLGSEHPKVANGLSDLARLYVTVGKYHEAEPLLRRSLEIREKVLGPAHPDVTYPLTNLAWIYYRLGRYSEAEPLYRRVLAIREQALAADHPYIAWALSSLADLYYVEGQYAQAKSYFDRWLNSIGRQFEYDFGYMSEKERLQALASVSAVFPRFFSFCITYKDEDPSLAGKMFDVLLWEKGFIAQSVAALRSRIVASGDPEALGLLDQLSSKKTQISALIDLPKSGDAAARRKQIESLEEEANDLERQLVKRSASFAEEKRLARATWQDVQKALKPGEAAVEMVHFRFDDGRRWSNNHYYVALIVTPQTTVAPQLVVLGKDEDVATSLEQYRNEVDVRGSLTVAAQPKPGPPASGAAIGGKLYAASWKPLEPALKQAHTVYVSPDGVLNQVSWAVLADSDGRLLAEKYDLRLVSNTRDLLRAKQPASAGSATLIGDPAYSLDDDQQHAAVRSLGTSGGDKVELASLKARSGFRSRDQDTGELPPLPGTGAEVKSVANLLKTHGWHVATYTQASALEEAVKRVQHPRVLHLATHGFFLSDQAIQRENAPGPDITFGMEDPMLRSGVFLAGANRTLAGHPPADLEDGVLTAYEASSLNLQGTELVVLSACETGLGKVEAGEGVFGLRRAFQVAGADAVLMSLWSVPDRETQELMTLFYEKWLAGKDKHEALREAQLEEREVVKKRYGQDLPFYWGAFILVGR